MKKTITLLTAAALSAASFNAHAFDPKEFLNSLRGDTTSTANSSDDNNSGSGGILGSLGSLIGNVAANDRFSIDDLIGTWNYTSPAVSFQSDNALKKIGGAGAATAVENKLSPYYTRLGFNRTTLTVDTAHNFVLKAGALTLKGKIEKDETDKSLIFNFNAFGKIPLGKVKAHATKAGKTLNLTFDATKMIQLLTKVSSALNISTLNTLSTILNGYDGIYMGFKLKEQ